MYRAVGRSVLNLPCCVGMRTFEAERGEVSESRLISGH
jgi:hypothetical protein